ncbi:pyridoxal phosphate-dependent transferase [Globomyces pollinis-pini]|nr:pyridoxal phosphate-dependent transferase [Globomyces pollinis-pini]
MYRERLGDSIYVQAIQFLQEKHYDFGKFSKENILGTSGVSGGVISAIMMLKEKLNSRPGPVKIGLFNPFYVYHREIATGVFGTNVEFVYLDVNEDMSFDFQIIRENACHLDMIMFTNPGNPSTHVMTKEEVDKFVLVAQEFKHCYVISDEVYSDMIQPGFKHTSFHSPIPENIIVLRGFSKCMAVGSWRLGYALGHQDTIANLARSHDRVFICANWTQMAVGYYIMNQYEDYVQYLYNINLTMVKNYQMINNSILEMGWSILPPQGSMYLLCKHNCDDDLKAMVLLIKKGLVAVPGYMFMSDPLKQYNTGYLRFHVAYSLVKGQLVSDRLVGEAAIVLSGHPELSMNNWE